MKSYEVRFLGFLPAPPVLLTCDTYDSNFDSFLSHYLRFQDSFDFSIFAFATHFLVSSSCAGLYRYLVRGSKQWVPSISHNANARQQRDPRLPREAAAHTSKSAELAPLLPRAILAGCGCLRRNLIASIEYVPKGCRGRARKWAVTPCCGAATASATSSPMRERRCSNLVVRSHRATSRRS